MIFESNIPTTNVESTNESIASNLTDTIHSQSAVALLEYLLLSLKSFGMSIDIHFKTKSQTQ